MRKITTVSELRIEIERMEGLQDADLILLREQFKITQEGLTPSNLIKKTFKNIFSSPEVKTSLINATMGITSGIVAEKIIVGNSHNPIKKIMGAAIKFLVTNKVVKNADEIKIIGGMILNKITKKSTENNES
jgi:metal-dependent hydrolase (beta-lactamase superfamily II)